MFGTGPEVLSGFIKDLRGFQSLLFISFKKGHTSDISPTTLSSWLKQIILLCYKQTDQQALDLVQVKLVILGPCSLQSLLWGGGLLNQIIEACQSQSQSWGFTSRSTARVILGQVLRIATCALKLVTGRRTISHKFLPKRPRVVRQQQYVSGHICCKQVFQSLIPRVVRYTCTISGYLVGSNLSFISE